MASTIDDSNPTTNEDSHDDDSGVAIWAIASNYLRDVFLRESGLFRVVMVRALVLGSNP